MIEDTIAVIWRKLVGLQVKMNELNDLQFPIGFQYFNLNIIVSNHYYYQTVMSLNCQIQDIDCKHFLKENALKRYNSSQLPLFKLPFQRNSLNSNIKPQNEHQISRNPWDSVEESKLLQLHQQIGNKWALIATHLPGRSDNCVKNHFYSKLRKSFRKINRIINCFLYREFQTMKMTAIYKIVQLNDQKHKKGSRITKEEILYCKELLYELLDFGQKIQNYQNQTQISQAKTLIKKVSEFNLKHKKINKKRKNQQEQEFVPGYYVRRLTRKTVRGSDSDSSFCSDNGMIFQQEDLEDNEEKNDQVRQLMDLQLIYMSKKMSMKNELRLIEGRDEVKDILSHYEVVEEDKQMPILYLGNNISKLSKVSGKFSEMSFNWENIDESPFNCGNYALTSLVNDYLKKDISTIQ